VQKIEKINSYVLQTNEYTELMAFLSRHIIHSLKKQTCNLMFGKTKLQIRMVHTGKRPDDKYVVDGCLRNIETQDSFDVQEID